MSAAAPAGRNSRNGRNSVDLAALKASVDLLA